MTASIRVIVKDHTGENCATMQLPGNRTIRQILPRILDRLALPQEEDSGEPISYALYNDSEEGKPYLEQSQKVREVVREGQRLCTVPEIIAGAR